MRRTLHHLVSADRFNSSGIFSSMSCKQVPTRLLGDGRDHTHQQTYPVMMTLSTHPPSSSDIVCSLTWAGCGVCLLSRQGFSRVRICLCLPEAPFSPLISFGHKGGSSTLFCRGGGNYSPPAYLLFLLQGRREGDLIAEAHCLLFSIAKSFGDKGHCLCNASCFLNPSRQMPWVLTCWAHPPVGSPGRACVHRLAILSLFWSYSDGWITRSVIYLLFIYGSSACFALYPSWAYLSVEG